MDKKYGDEWNICTDIGLRNWMLSLRCVLEHGYMWMGNECKTFIWMARSIFKRNRENPQGDTDHPQVQEANICCALLALAYPVLARGRVREYDGVLKLVPPGLVRDVSLPHLFS